MNKSLKLLRAAREALGLDPLSEMAEHVYFDALVPHKEELIVAALRSWLRSTPGIPAPYELRSFIAHMPSVTDRANTPTTTQEVSHD